jgi:hypothetical protein
MVIPRFFNGANQLNFGCHFCFCLGVIGKTACFIVHRAVASTRMFPPPKVE